MVEITGKREAIENTSQDALTIINIDASKI
jgi:hypothetical protein